MGPVTLARDVADVASALDEELLVVSASTHVAVVKGEIPGAGANLRAQLFHQVGREASDARSNHGKRSCGTLNVS